MKRADADAIVKGLARGLTLAAACRAAKVDRASLDDAAVERVRLAHWRACRSAFLLALEEWADGRPLDEAARRAKVSRSELLWHAEWNEEFGPLFAGTRRVVERSLVLEALDCARQAMREGKTAVIGAVLARLELVGEAPRPSVRLPDLSPEQARELAQLLPRPWQPARH